MLLENELTLLVEGIFFIYNLSSALTGNSEDIPTEHLVLGIAPSLEPIMSFEEKELISDRLNYYLQQVDKCLEQLPEWMAQKEKKLKLKSNKGLRLLLDDFVQRQVSILKIRVQHISAHSKSAYLEYYGYFKTLTNKMDDWVIQGIKH